MSADLKNADRFAFFTIREPFSCHTFLVTCVLQKSHCLSAQPPGLAEHIPLTKAIQDILFLEWPKSKRYLFKQQ